MRLGMVIGCGGRRGLCRLPDTACGPATLAAIVAVIRRATPVPQGDRGLLPKA